MSITAEFIETNFKRISVLKENANGRTELVADTTGAVYIRKIIARTGLPYKKLVQINARIYLKFIIIRKHMAKLM